jgi:hypothetical protein
VIDGYRAYKFYLATRLHFTTDKYDVFASKGAVTCSRDSFEKRNDKYMFMKLGQRFNTEREYIQFLASNFIYGNPNVIYSGSEADENYTEWQRRKQSATKLFSDDCDKLIASGKCYDDIFYCTKNTFQYIISLYVGKKINIETVRILDDQLEFIKHIPSDSSMATMFGDQIRIIKKAKGFIKYNKERVTPIVDNLLEELLGNTNGQYIQEAIASV